MYNAFRSLALGIASLLLTGCASTTIQSAWFDPGFKGGPFKKIVVVGGGSNTTNRRVFEDIFVGKLRAAGVDAVQGYMVIPDEARANEAPFTAAVERSGANAALMVRLLDVDTRTQVSTQMVPGPTMGMGGPWGPWGGPWGGGFYGPTWTAVPVVSQYELANVEVKLFDVGTRALVWSGTTQTFNPTSVAQETPGFADIIIGQLRARGLIAVTAK